MPRGEVTRVRWGNKMEKKKKITEVNNLINKIEPCL